MTIPSLLQTFSNREWATIIYIILALILFLGVKKLDCNNLIRAFFKKRILLILVATILYISAMVLLLSSIKICGVALWNDSLLKDTIIWTLFTGVATLFNLPSEKNNKSFSTMLSDNFKAVVIFQFIFNLYSFPLWIEMIIMFIIFWVTIIQVHLKHSLNKHSSEQILNSPVSIISISIGITIIIYSIYNIIVDSENINLTNTALTFTLPLLLITLTIPYYYAVSLIMQYEMFVVQVSLKYYKDQNTARKFIWATIYYANVSLSKLHKASKRLGYYYEAKESPAEYVKRVVRTKRYRVGVNAKFELFNDVREVVMRLESVGVGVFSEYLDRSNRYDSSSATHYLECAKGRQTTTFVQYNIYGEEHSLHEIHLELHTATDQYRQQTLESYKSFIINTFEALEIPLPDELLPSLDDKCEYNLDSETYTIQHTYNEYKTIMYCTLTISTKLLL